ETAEGVHQDRGSDTERGAARALDGALTGAALVDDAGPGAGPEEVVLQDGLEVGLLPHLFEEGEPDLRVLDRDVPGSEQGPAAAGSVPGAQTGGQEAEGTPGALEIRDGRPALPHQVDQRRVERVGGPDPVAQGEALGVRALLLRGRNRERPPHTGD